MTQFYNLNALKMWAKTNEVKFLDGDALLPYVLVDGQFYYFAKNLVMHHDNHDKPVFNPSLLLVMVSSRDLNISEEAQA